MFNVLLSKFFLVIIVSSFLFISGCSLVYKIAGADIDPLQFEKARQAKVLEVRMNSLAKLSSKLALRKNLDDDDFTFYLSQDLLSKIVAQYRGISGWFDNSTSFKVNYTELSLQNGSAIVSLDLSAYNSSYNVDVNLIMDCQITFDKLNDDLYIRLEPFNITPKVNAYGLLSSADEIIQNLIKKNLADTEKNFPPLKIPIDISNEINIEQSKSEVRDKLDLNIIASPKKLLYRLKLSDVLIFENAAVVSMNIEKVEVK
jgi:hypothetical protein